MILPHQEDELVEKLRDMKELLEDTSDIINIPDKFEKLKEILEEIEDIIELD